MATAVQGVHGAAGLELVPERTAEGVSLFGIRHLSAAGAWHVRRFLDDVNPDCVLIESPSDTTPLIPHIVKPGVKPPLAVLCYTSQTPVHSILYPLAGYSPEYQAMLWAAQNKKKSRFIDLPSGVKASLYRFQEEERVRNVNSRMEAEAQGTQLSGQMKMREDYYEYNAGLYESLWKISGEPDFEAYWERNFEHNLDFGSYHKAVALHSAEMRRLTIARELEADPLASSINILREAYMKRCINEEIASGTPPEKIAVICGAYHVEGLLNNAPMSDEELAKLPFCETKMTLMPYSYYRLSSFSGYGAGNIAPYYYELMHSLMEQGRLEDLPGVYLSKLSALLREKHGYSSTANVIESLRLAQSLQYMHGGILPTLRDLHDAAVATMGGGHEHDIATAFAALDVGTAIGALPDGVSQTPIQDDMNSQLKRLKLEKYKTVVAQDLELDLRENRRVQSEEAAFLDLERSVFLNRLLLLGIDFVKPGYKKQDSATWAESWILCWTPEAEIQLVESVLLGDSIEAAAAYSLKEKLERSEDVVEVAKLVYTACVCRLSHSIHDAIKKLQDLTADSENFGEVARAAREISFLIQYGTIRRFESEPVIPVLQQLFLKGALLLYSCASVNDDAARKMADDMALMHFVSQEHDEVLPSELWISQLERLARSDERNPMLSGFAFSILLEHGLIKEEELYTEVSRHLSPGNTPVAGALWFEGLARRNRYVLLSRTMLWQQLDLYIKELDDDDFKRALVCLRRAFSSFEASEKAGVCDILADLWGVDGGSVAELLSGELSEQEQQALDDLNDFDFGDL